MKLERKHDWKRSNQIVGFIVDREAAISIISRGQVRFIILGQANRIYKEDECLKVMLLC